MRVFKFPEFSLLLFFLLLLYSAESIGQCGSVFGSSFNLNQINGTNGFIINGEFAGDQSGFSVSNAGDINGDLFDDIVIGAFAADANGKSNAGKVYLIYGKSSSFSNTIDLSELDGSNGFVINGVDPNDRTGYSVSNAGDMNNDGFGDLLISVSGADRNGSQAGGAYVLFGKATSFGAAFNLADIDGSNGFVINGRSALDESGVSVSNAGDINGDLFDDIIVGAYKADPNGRIDAGASYVVFGQATPYPASFDLNDLNGSNGFVINGIDTDDWSGYSVSSAGDINDDGLTDILIDARKANNVTGEVYVVFGKTAPFAASLNLSSLNGSNGFKLSGIDAFDFTGYSASNAGDINADNIDDLIISAYRADPDGKDDAGETYVIFGKRSSFGSNVNLSNLNGSNGFVINGIDADDRSGFSVSNAGDVNNDGIDDVIIGARHASPSGKLDAGESYVLYGKSSPFSASFNLSDLNGTNGFIINGIDAGDWSGNSVSNAGDVNVDGIDDLIIGAWFADPKGNITAGESYVVFGRSLGNCGCPFAGLACDDGIDCTTNDSYTNNCQCVGILDQSDSDNDGICDSADVCPGLNDNLIGTPCNDGNACTVGERYTTNCECSGGVGGDIDNDGICDALDECNNNLTGTPCDDGNPCTSGEKLDANCACSGGVYLDEDNDGVCDEQDVCLGFNNSLFGTLCDDGNPLTAFDVYSESECGCLGTLIASDFCRQLNIGGDDAEESDDGEVSLTGLDLDMKDGNIVGLRFQNIDIPNSASVTNATIQFGSDETDSEATTITIRAQATDNAAPFSTGNFSLSNKVKTVVAVNWLPQSWDGVGLMTNAQKTNDLSPLVQEVINRPGFKSGNAISFILESTGSRVAESFNSVPSLAAELCISYSLVSCQVGQSCNDGDVCTVGETYDANCECTGGVIQDSDGDGVCDAQDQCSGLNDNLIGQTCDDGDVCTVGELYNSNCQCVGGIFQDSDADGICNANDQCPGFNNNLIGQACNDGDACTISDTYKNNCECTGIVVQDSDGDGVCNAEDQCPGINDNLIGQVCNDGDVCTVGERYNTNCQCVGGVVQDSDGDGICNAEDLCPGFNDNLIGQACNDGDACTIGDSYTSNCECSGVVVQDSDGDGVCNAEDKCPGFNDNLIGQACSDGDDCTAGEIYSINCECSGGTLVDTDNNGVCDLTQACDVLNFTDFEQGTGIWQTNGNHAFRLLSSNSPSGSYSFMIRDNKGIASSFSSAVMDLTSHGLKRISFSFKSVTLSVGEGFYLESSSDGGSSFQIIRKWTNGAEFENNIIYQEVIDLASQDLSSTMIFRFRADIDINDFVTHQIYVDDIKLESCPFLIDCEQNIVQLNNSMITKSAFAEFIILSNGVVMAGEDIEFSAGNEIQLQGNFEVKAGAIFHAFINSCPN